MLISKLHRTIAYDMMLIVCLIIVGYTIGIKIYILSFMFILVAFLSHSRLYNILEIKEENPLEP